MEGLYSLLVSSLVAANVLAPSSDVLGKQIAQNTTIDTSIRADEELEDESESEDLDSEVRTNVNTRLLQRQREIELKRVEVRSNIQTRKEEAASRSAEKREEFQAKLQEVRDEREKRILANLDTRFTKLNEKWVEHWNNVLSRLEEILAKLETRLAEYEGDKDTAALSSAIDKAQAAISEAQDVVTVQSGNTYIIELGEEENIGESVRALIAEFKTDVQDVWDIVKSAREEVHNVFVEVRKLTNLGNNTENNAEEE